MNKKTFTAQFEMQNEDGEVLQAGTCGHKHRKYGQAVKCKEEYEKTPLGEDYLKLIVWVA